MQISKGLVSADLVGVTGPIGFYGPNDYGYVHNAILKAADALKGAQRLFSQGHYPHSDAKIIDDDDPLRLAMTELAKLDEKYCRYANREPDKDLFSTYEPPFEDTIRWSKFREIQEPIVNSVGATADQNNDKRECT